MFFDTHIFACTNRRPNGDKKGCCASKGSQELRDYFKEQVAKHGIRSSRVNTAGCLGLCAQGPVFVIYPQAIWYRLPDTAAIDRVVTEHLLGGTVVEAYRLTPPITASKAIERPDA